MGKSSFKVHLGQKCETVSEKLPKQEKKKKAGVTQVIECLASKCKSSTKVGRKKLVTTMPERWWRKYTEIDREPRLPHLLPWSLPGPGQRVASEGLPDGLVPSFPSSHSHFCQ
jgi:hypothetical protein